MDYRWSQTECHQMSCVDFALLNDRTEPVIDVVTILKTLRPPESRTLAKAVVSVDQLTGGQMLDCDGRGLGYDDSGNITLRRSVGQCTPVVEHDRDINRPRRVSDCGCLSAFADSAGESFVKRTFKHGEQEKCRQPPKAVCRVCYAFGGGV